MAIVSGGVLKKSPQIVWQGTTADPGFPTVAMWLSSYGAIYRSHLWVATLVNKIGNATARLPLKTYRRDGDGRVDARDTPYGRLIAKPSRRWDPFFVWLWTASILNVYGEAFFAKIRDKGGRPVELVLIHPTRVRRTERDGKTTWQIDLGGTRYDVARRDLVHFKHFNPDSLDYGLSPLEPLRSTLENEEFARRANSALWRHGGRPSIFLTHPKVLSKSSADRLAADWSDLHGGVDNWAKPAVLEEGMKAETVALNAEELQYVEARKLNREEACAIYDVPPPAVHILDHATYSNITEQMRSLYRDTMAPRLGLLESTLEFELRDGSYGVGEPDFGDDVYAEFLLDEVLRGDFEARTTAIAQAVQFGTMTPAEGRQIENRPFIPGSDRLLVNSTMVPLDSVAASDGDSGQRQLSLVEMIQKIYLGVGSVITVDEAREILNQAGAHLTGPGPEAVPAPSPLDPATVRTVLGRTSRAKTIDDIDPVALTAGLNGSTETVLAVLDASKAAGETLAQLRERFGALEVNP